MKRLAALVPLFALSAPVLAAPPTAAQQDEFYSVCMGIAQDAADYDAYNTYVAKSNQVCKPNY